jgi:hypothetical protein
MAIDPVRAETPTFWPNACICGTQTGPFVDTGIDKLGERIYLCKLCTKLAGLTLGFIDGPEHDKLENAAGELHDLTLDRDRLRERIVLLEVARRERNERIAEVSEELDQATGRVAQLEQTLDDVRRDIAAKIGEIPIEDEASAREVSPVGR